MNEPLPQAAIAVPDDQDMALEPARTIGAAMQLKNAVVAVLVITGYAISPAFDDAISQGLQAGITLALMLWGFYRTHRQAERTRAAVYSPASAAAIATLEPEAVTIETGEPALVFTEGPAPPNPAL